MARIAQALTPLPRHACRSITFDRGTEFAAYRVLLSRLGLESYFCEPKSPWQKGAVENLNGRLRRFLPSDTDIAAMDPAVIAAICAQLNSTPRKCLGYQTPLEVLSAEISRHSE